MIELFERRGAFSVKNFEWHVSLSANGNEEFKARSQVEDWGKLDLEGLLSKLAAKSQCSQPVQARAQASGGSCSSGSCSSGDALVGCATAGSGTIVARAERMAQRRHLRARSLGFEPDEAAEEEVAVETVETSVVAQVETPAVAQVETPAVAMVAQVDRVAQVEKPVVTAVVLVETPVGARGEQRKREDELLVRYEQLQGSCPNARLELSSLTSVALGTLDGMLSRARKRRKVATALA